MIGVIGAGITVDAERDICTDLNYYLPGYEIPNEAASESEFLSFIAVSESTPGPLAVNMATFIGSSQAGLPGALVATLGVVLPSFVIILLVAAVLRSVLRYAGVQAVLDGVRPCVVAMILATAVMQMVW